MKQQQQQQQSNNNKNNNSNNNHHHHQKDVTLVVRQSRWSPNPETVLADAERDSNIINLNLLGLSFNTTVLEALVRTLKSKRRQRQQQQQHKQQRRRYNNDNNNNNNNDNYCTCWNQVHIHQCHTMDLDCTELAMALTTHVRSLVLSGSTGLLNAVLNNNYNHNNNSKPSSCLETLTINQPRTGLKETQCLQLGKFLAATTTSSSSSSSQLKHLSLKGTALQAPGLLAPGLSTAKQLETLILSDTGLSEQGKADLIVCCCNNSVAAVNHTTRTKTTRTTKSTTTTNNNKNNRTSTPTTTTTTTTPTRSKKRQFGIGAVRRLLVPSIPSSSTTLTNGNGSSYICSNLMALDLSNLHLQDEHAANIFQALAECDGNGGNSSNSSSFSFSKKSKSKLKQLNLSFNDITCDGIIAISHYIPSLTTLSKVSLKPNPWNARGAAALVIALEQNTSIEYLDSLLLVRQAPMLRYYTALNRGGRRILTSSSPIPLGLWPIVLERAGGKSISYEHQSVSSHFEDDPKAKYHAIYHLLRNGNFLV